ncbi:MAG: sigma-70 family RNA polymerase sigma factor [Oscillospiraceae bacterium]|nr:sigma-70 family RNA polymerase sigma factor [Oscillospiraceae bacterium]MCL2279114.1 sigma-70 family RNA polymerase sigma factor [Oscillospiraceae bacterium]
MLIFYLSALETEEERMKLAELYHEYEPLMFRYAMKLMGSAEQSQDAVHDAFLAVIRHKEKYLSLSDRNFRSLIVIIVKSKCLDLIKREKKTIPVAIEDMTFEEPIERSGEEIFLKNEKAEKLHQAVKRLDETSRIILEMKYVLGMSYKEIAAETNLTTKQIDNNMMKAKAKTRKYLEESGEANDEQ